MLFSSIVEVETNQPFHAPPPSSYTNPNLPIWSQTKLTQPKPWNGGEHKNDGEGRLRELHSDQSLKGEGKAVVWKTILLHVLSHHLYQRYIEGATYWIEGKRKGCLFVLEKRKIKCSREGKSSLFLQFYVRNIEQ